MKKRVIALFLIMLFAFSCTSTYAMAAPSATIKENVSIRRQAATLISTIDEDSLIEDALSNKTSFILILENIQRWKWGLISSTIQ